MQAYNKLFVALAGLIILIGHKYLGVDLSGTEQLIADVLIGALMAAGIYQVPNKQ